MTQSAKAVKIGLSALVAGFAVGWAIANPKKPSLVGVWEGQQRGIATRTEFRKDGTFDTLAKVDPKPIEMHGKWKADGNRVTMYDCKTIDGATLPDHTVGIQFAGKDQVTFELNGEKGEYKRVQ